MIASLMPAINAPAIEGSARSFAPRRTGTSKESDMSRRSRGIARAPCSTCTTSPGTADTTAQKTGALNPNPNHMTPSRAHMYAGRAMPTVTMSVK